MRLDRRIFDFKTFQIEYLLDEDTRQISMILLPEGKSDSFGNRREWLEIPEMVRVGMDKRAWDVGSLVHLSHSGHPQGKGTGETLKHGPAVSCLCFKEQFVEKKEAEKKIVTILEDEAGYQVRHTVIYTEGENGVKVQTSFINLSQESVWLDLLTSVSLDNLSPFLNADPHNNIVLHRFYGGWSLEGKHREDFLEKLNLERSWMCAFPESEKFGSVGSYPVHRYFPTACVEDRESGVFWGVQLEAPASWQMELSRDGDCCSFSAGQADAEFGGWSKKIEPGERFDSRKAYVSVDTSLDNVCADLLDMHAKYAETQPESEKELPVIFNDWCASYGEPSAEKTLQYAERLKDTPVRYIVIDAGWTESPEKSFGQGGNGDWNYSKKRFPDGIGAVAQKLKKRGFQLGIWFEFEVTTEGASVYEKEYDHLHLTRNGYVINSGGDRTFWDFRKKEVWNYLRHKVIDFLKENEISYLKIDYNSSIGAGCDGAETLAEGLRGQMEKVQEFLKEIRRELPNLVIENCAAGGHRLEASFMDLSSMSSFSDAHECKELPYIAANLQRLVPATKNQIWVVINKYLSEKEIYYRLASGFMGRFCLSGDIGGVKDSEWEIVCHAMELYRKSAYIISLSHAKVTRTPNKNMHHPKGIQIVDRKYGDKRLIVIHSFDGVSNHKYLLENCGWQVKECMMRKEGSINVENDVLKINRMEAGDGAVLLLENR